MSDRFYHYLSEKLLEYFYKNNPIKGDRFYINFEEKNQVKSLCNSLNEVAKDIVTPFTYTNEVSNEVYNTYSLDINGVKLVVAENIKANINFLVKLRNLVPTQKDIWKDSAMLIICYDANDSITDGARDLEKEGMPFNVKYISENIEDEIANSSLKIAEKCITKFALKNQEDETFQITLWDYEAILSILKEGHIDEEDFKELNLFKDTHLETDFLPTDSFDDAYKKLIKKGRLSDNFENFVKVKSYSQYDNKEEKLEKMVTSDVVKKLSKPDWYNVEWDEISTSIKKREDELKHPLEYEGIENIENGLEYWDRPFSTTKSGLRKRNIIVFNNKNCNNLSLKLKFKDEIDMKYVHKKYRDFVKRRGKYFLNVSFDLDSTKPTFKSIKYKHNFNFNKKNDNEEGPVTEYTFNILVLNSSEQLFKSIKYRYSLKDDLIIVTNDEDSDEIVFGNGKTLVEIEKKGQVVYLSDDEGITISEQGSEWDNSELSFDLNYNDNLIHFSIKEKKERTVPKPSSFIWNIKRKNRDHIVFNGVKAIQGTNSFYLEDKFKYFLNLEKQIIEENIFYAKEIDHSIKRMDVSFDEDLEEAYLDILNYFRGDDSSEINLPSLVYLDDKLKHLYEKFISLFNKEVSEIPEGTSLSNIETKKDLLKLGRIDTENRVMYSPLSPINIAYQLELSNQCGYEDLSNNIVERLVPNNLIPFLFSENDELYKPIFQNHAHEWIIFEKESKVSIGTTNAFISRLVSEKLTQFENHFSYLFSVNTLSPIKINLINISDDVEVVKGIFDFVRSRLPDKGSEKKVIPVEINIYSDSDTSFDKFFECNSEEQFIREFGLKNLGSDLYDPIDIIHLVQNNISYYKHPYHNKGYEYSHISFFKVNSYNTVSDTNMDSIETGLSLNGALSSLNSTTETSVYRTGFGTRNILDFDNTAVKTAINMNELAFNSKNRGMDTYHKNLSIVTTIQLEEENLQELYEKSHWITFINPAFGIEYFDKFNENLVIIHYSDQYTSSSKYDTITITNRYHQYEDTIKEFLSSKNIHEADEKHIWEIIKIFNSINGEWLLRLISNSSKKQVRDRNQYSREKLSIISAIKYGLVILNHDDIFWIPASMEEVLRIAGNVKLDKKGGIFESGLKGRYSDDILFIGLKSNGEDIDIIFHPIEVKIGRNESDTIQRGLEQVDNTYNLLKEKLNQFDEDNEFRNKFFRNFFIQILLSNEKKLVNNHIWDKKHLETIEEFKAKLLNDEFKVSRILEEVIGIGSLISFKELGSLFIKTQEKKRIIEIPENLAYTSLVKSVEDIQKEIREGQIYFPPEDLLFNVDLNSLEEPIDDDFGEDSGGIFIPLQRIDE